MEKTNEESEIEKNIVSKEENNAFIQLYANLREKVKDWFNSVLIKKVPNISINDLMKVYDDICLSKRRKFSHLSLEIERATYLLLIVLTQKLNISLKSALGDYSAYLFKNNKFSGKKYFEYLSVYKENYQLDTTNSSKSINYLHREETQIKLAVKKLDWIPESVNDIFRKYRIYIKNSKYRGKCLILISCYVYAKEHNLNFNLNKLNVKLDYNLSQVYKIMKEIYQIKN